MITGNHKSEREFQPVFSLIVTFLLSPQILFFLSSFWCSDSLPTTYITCSLRRVSIFVKIAAECVCNILIFLFKLNTHCQINFFFKLRLFFSCSLFCNVGRNKTCFLCLEKCFVFVKCCSVTYLLC